MGLKSSVHDFYIFVESDVWATYFNREGSIVIFLSLNSSRISNALFLAISNPSVIIRGWTPSNKRDSAYLRSSPMKRTLLVVPSPTDSSCATEHLAIIAAVGC